MRKISVFIWKMFEKTMLIFLKMACKLCHKECTEEVQTVFMQFVKFGIVGVSNTLISYFIYIIMLFFFQSLGLLEQYDYLAAQVIGFVLSVLWSFYWNNKMVFTRESGSKRILWKTLLKTFAAYSFTGLFLNSVLLILWVNVLGVSEYVAPVFNLLFSVPLNFLINKFWAFR